MKEITLVEKIALIKELDEKQESLTISINNLMLKEEDHKKKTLKAEEFLRLEEQKVKDNQEMELNITSVELTNNKEVLSDLRKLVVFVKGELEEVKGSVQEAKLLAKNIIDIAENKANAIIEKAKNSEIVMKNISVEIDNKRDVLARIENSIIRKENEETMVYSSLLEARERVSKIKEELVELEKRQEKYNGLEEKVSKALHIIERANTTNQDLEKVRSEIVLLKTEKEELTAEIEKLHIDKDKKRAEEIEIIKIKGNLIQKETSISQRVSLLKDLYGNLKLPW